MLEFLGACVCVFIGIGIIDVFMQWLGSFFSEWK
jgi:hypothetical protein